MHKDDFILMSVVLILLCVVFVYAALTGLWVLLALPTGFFFGFFLQRGDLCGASACSEVLLFRSWSKLGGFWICIVVYMCGFALASRLGWIEFYAKPFFWLNMIVGGAIFGTGMVLAGGCITGSLFKTATGNINSLVALVGIPIGVGLVNDGLLSPVRDLLSRYAIYPDGDEAITLASLTGVSYTAWALLFAGITVAGIAVFKKRGKPTSWLHYENRSLFNRIFVRPWKPWVAGLAIGLLALPAYIGACRCGFESPLGTTGGLYSVVLLAGDEHVDLVYTSEISGSNDKVETVETTKTVDAAGTTEAVKAAEKGETLNAASEVPHTKVYLWLPLLCAGLMAGAGFGAKLSRSLQWLPKPKSQVVIAFLGGILVGLGAALAEGCFYGNIVSGCALLHTGGFLFAPVTILAAWITTRLYLIGGGWFIR